MFSSLVRHRKISLIVLGLVSATALSVLSFALPSGGWEVSGDPECVDSTLVCATWEFAGGGSEGPCCVTMSDFYSNRFRCTSFDFRD